MIVRAARPDDAEAAATVLRRSIVELCQADHRDDPDTLRRWLSNKTPEHVRAWIADPGNWLVVAEEEGRILGVAAMQTTGRVNLNYVLPEARFTAVRFSIARSPVGWDWRVFGVAAVDLGHGSI